MGESKVSSKVKNLSKNTLILGIGNFSSKILVFFLVPLYTSVLSTDEYGNYDLAVTTIQLLAPIITVNIADAVMRYLFDKDKNKEDVASIGFNYLAVSSVVFVLLLMICTQIKRPAFLLDNTIWIFLYYIGYIFQAYFCQLAKGVERVIDICIAGVLGTLVTLLLNILLLLVFKTGIWGFFVANTLGNFAQILFYFFRIKAWKIIHSISRKSKNLQLEMVKYSAPLILSSLAWAINNSLDKYMVNYFSGPSESGLLGIAYKIPTIMNVCSMFFIQAWQISAIAELESGNAKSFFSKVYIAFNTFVSVGCSGLILFTRPISRILFANEFYIAWKYVPFLLLSMCFSLSATFIGPLLAAKKDSKSMANSAVAGAIVNIVMNYILIKNIGVIGATIATAISSFVIFIFRKKSANDMFEREKTLKGYLSWIILVIQGIVEVYFSSFIFSAGCLMLIIIINVSSIKYLISNILKRGAE